MRLFEAIARFLADERDGRPVFGLMGDANLAYLGAYIERHHGRYIAAAVEGGAVLMADGWARMSGQLGIVTVTHGPALTNTLTALIEAVQAKTPMVLLTGDTPDVNEHFQYVDIQGFARSAGAGYERVKTAATALQTLRKAFVRARLDSRPIVVDVPYPLVGHDVEWTETAWPSTDLQRIAPDPDAVDEALGLLMSAKRPLVIAGRGAVESGARADILALARAVGAPVMTTLLGRELFLGEPENLGVHGTLSTPAAVDYMGQADVVVSFGASLNNWTTDHYELLAGKRVIQSDRDPGALAKYGPITHGVVGDARAVAQAMLARLDEAGHTGPAKPPRYLAAIAAAPGREAKDLFRSTSGGGFMDMREAALAISDALPAGTQQVHDVGRYSYSVWPHITTTPGRWHYAGHFGSIGLGIAFGAGAAAVRDDVPTVAWVGDGGAMHGIVEVNTAVRHGLPLIVVVMNDQCYGAEYIKLQLVGSQASTSFVPWSSFAEVARGLGAHAVRVTDRGGLDRAAEAIAQQRFPLVIEVVADADKVVNQPSVSPLPEE
ncbi:thiamine pyrophosphate-binding protein [Brevibacterium sp. 5221]|uniref:Thiamine pyrophosphate-binding protein n=1 Tax=Brevibacterium rongguiense TaxID=2695267 RepID=A0A6N9H642_9MICO|nr:thiamine pyrophosphate-binding protein [Brevibacterium rongguiense]MYM19365.1 thiamine pyrophosphate-binding protein [Brevibacterium rongguiense]